MNNKIILLILIGISYNYTHSQCEVKTTHRPDGVTIKYFKPKPIIRNSNFEVGVSIYKNENTNDYMLSVSVLFMKMLPKDLERDLVIQTTNTNGLRLKQVLSKQITMNGRVLANAMYIIEQRDFEELSNYSLKSVFFHLGENLEGSTVSENNKILNNELQCLLK